MKKNNIIVGRFFGFSKRLPGFIFKNSMPCWNQDIRLHAIRTSLGSFCWDRRWRRVGVRCSVNLCPSPVVSIAGTFFRWFHRANVQGLWSRYFQGVYLPVRTLTAAPLPTHLGGCFASPQGCTPSPDCYTYVFQKLVYHNIDVPHSCPAG